MSEPDSEEMLRARVRDALAALPGPDRARLAAIERALSARRRRRRWPWALALALGLTAAAAAAWYGLAPPRTPAPESAPARGEQTPARSAAQRAHRTPPAHDAAGRTEPPGADDPARAAPLIYRE